MEALRYIFVASVCLSLFYLAYRLLFRQCTNFQHARLFLLTSMIFSLIIPLSGFSIKTNWLQKKQAEQVVLTVKNTVNDNPLPEKPQQPLWLIALKQNWKKIAVGIYLSVSGIFLIRILIMLIILRLQYGKSYKVRLADCILLYNHRFRNTFSFFRWIFIHPVPDDSELEQIITHEKVHVYQYHSFDILLIELLSAVMWFNPFAWMLKGSLQLVHEYQADDGALQTGIDKSKYQALLINQVAEERLVALSSSFNQSVIKKRIIMMTKSKIRKRSVLKMLAIVPIALLLFLLMAVFNGSLTQDVQAGGGEMYITKNMGSLVALLPEPLDTIIKKTITKKIKNNDTIVEEKEEILTGKEAEEEKELIRNDKGEKNHIVVIHDSDDRIRHEGDGESNEVSVYVESGDKVRHERSTGHVESYTVRIDGDKEFREEDFGDSVRTVKIIRHGNGEPQIEKHVVIKYSDEKPISRILYMVDGQPFNKPMETLNVNQIESMTVIKGKDIEKYTKEDYDGVILINMKKGAK